MAEYIDREQTLMQLTGSFPENMSLEKYISLVFARLNKLPTADVVEIPKNATNSDMIMAMFPNIKIHKHEETDICDAYIQIDIWDFSIYVSEEWWNAPYKRG